MKLSLITISIILSILSGQEISQSSPAESKTKSTIAVLTLEGKGITNQEAEILTERLRSTLVRDGRYQVVERSQMEEILREQGFQQAGCTTNECLIQAGLILGVLQMVGGTVGKIGNSYALDIRLFDVETAAIVRAVTRTHQGAIDDLLNIMEDIAFELAGEQPPKPTPSPATSYSDIAETTNRIVNAFEQFKTTLSGSGNRSWTSKAGQSEPVWMPFQFAFIQPE